MRALGLAHTATAVAAKLRFLPIPSEIADEARRTLTDRFGHRLHVTTTQAPCRLCLKISKDPEDLILLSYQPLADTGPDAEIGPIFIHAHTCAPYADQQTFPPDFASRPLVLRSYNAAGEIVDSLVSPPGTHIRFQDRSRLMGIRARTRSSTKYTGSQISTPIMIGNTVSNGVKPARILTATAPPK